jgi:hypothetical protein
MRFPAAASRSLSAPHPEARDNGPSLRIHGQSAALPSNTANTITLSLGHDWTTASESSQLRRHFDYVAVAATSFSSWLNAASRARPQRIENDRFYRVFVVRVRLVKLAFSLTGSCADLVRMQ